MLAILLSALFFWDVIFYFAAIFCIAMQKVKDGGWMALGMEGSRMGFPFGMKHCLQFSLGFVSPPFGRFDANLYAACRLSQL